MYCTRKITDSVTWIGGSDRRLALFENVFPVPMGISYNSYFIDDEKTAVMDTVDKSAGGRFFENLEHVLNGKKLDYLVATHMEPDHAATLSELVLRYPDTKIVCNAKSLSMIKQFFTFDIDSRALVVKEGDNLNLGNHNLKFISAPMVHWPEVMVVYEEAEKMLFSADAFGTFGAVSGNIFADEVDFDKILTDEARRYYSNIVGKYGQQVQALLKKTAALDIRCICPLHGLVWRKNIGKFIEKYRLWSSYTPEEKSVLIAYGSIYGGTENTVDILAAKLADRGVKSIAMFDVSVTHPSYIVSEAFRCSHVIFASATYNMEIFCNMDTLITDLEAHNFQNRIVAVIENGSWAPAAGKLITERLSRLGNMTFAGDTITVKSTLKEEQLENIDILAEAIVNSMV